MFLIFTKPTQTQKTQKTHSNPLKPTRLKLTQRNPLKPDSDNDIDNDN